MGASQGRQRVQSAGVTWVMATAVLDFLLFYAAAQALTVEEKAVADGTAVTSRRHACLMGCDHHCNVGLSAPGKITYVMGSFAPEAEAAEALVAFAALYDASETGQVPYRQWPQGVKGHFVSRVPPLPADDS